MWAVWITLHLGYHSACFQSSSLKIQSSKCAWTCFSPGGTGIGQLSLTCRVVKLYYRLHYRTLEGPQAWPQAFLILGDSPVLRGLAACAFSPLNMVENNLIASNNSAIQMWWSLSIWFSLLLRRLLCGISLSEGKYVPKWVHVLNL